MKKRFKLLDIDCASCAAKIEDQISKLDGVNSANISFMTQNVILDIDETRETEIMEQVEKVCKKVEPYCTLKF
ncbi:MAG: heavy-metal-associated domain-containing protein [Tissierellia bacterium]|nr:heavy-metal-associated domain-containing protein [Tissierellia bacterium]